MDVRHRFGEFLYDAAEARLTRGDVELELQPKVHDALRLFLERRGQLVTKEDLFGALWPQVHVSLEVLTQVVTKLRRALGDDPREPRFLHTVMKRGYRFDGAEPAAPAPAEPQHGEVQPPRGAYDPRWYVSRGEEEEQARAGLKTPGTPVVLFAAERFGKTWLLRHLVREARERGAVVVTVNLDLFDPPAWASLDACLRELARHIVAGVGRDAVLAETAFARSSNPKANLTWLLARELLPPIADTGGELVVAMDRVDASWGRSFRDDLFGLLRAWAENGAAESGWQSLRLLLAVSTTPALLVEDPSQSPFNISEPVRLRDLDDAQIDRVAVLHGVSLDAETRARVRELVGGHPYLLRLIFFAAAQRREPVARVLEDPEVMSGYLDHLRARLQRQPALLEALQAVARGEGRSIAPDSAGRLDAAGLVTHDDTGSLRLRYPLYQRLL